MMHRVTLLQSGKPITEGRPFEDYQDQPDTAERIRLAVQSIPFALPAKPVQPAPGTGSVQDIQVDKGAECP